MKKTLLTILLLLPTLFYGQSQLDNWLFGSESGIAFTPGERALIPNANIEAPAGCSSISNVDRELLFYTNGETVWNANHEVMEDGDGLSGEPENAQNSIIIPKPNSSTNYYIFTTRKNHSPLHVAGTKYSEVEISATYPLGKVIRKNVPLNIFFTEKITAIYNDDGTEIYVITFGTLIDVADSPFNTFSIYKVDSSGVSLRTTLEAPEASSNTSEGVIKASPDGTTIALAIYDFNDKEGIYLYDFDRSNGDITFRRKLSMNIGVGVWSVPYGLEFSQDSKFLYYSGKFNVGGNLIRQVQVNDTNGRNGEPVTITTSSSEIYRTMQLASNGRIYVAKKFDTEEQENANTIAYIEFPEVEGIACEFRRGDLNLTPMSIAKGLPNAIPNLFESRIFGENQCYVDPFSFTAESYVNITAIEWTFGDGNSSNDINATHTYSAPGEYMVEALLTLSNNTQTRIYKPVIAYELPVLTPNQELVECDDDSDGLTIFNLKSIRSKITDPSLNEKLFFYLSQNDLDNDNQIPDPENFRNTSINQEIFVKVVNENGCFESTSFFLNSKFVPLDDITDFFTCENSDGAVGNAQGIFNMIDIETSIRTQLNIDASTTLEFYRTKQDAQTNLNAIEDEFISTSTTIFVKGQEADLSCAGIKDFNVIVNSSLSVDLLPEYTICFDPSLQPPVILDGGISFDRHEWRDASDNLLSTNKDFTLDGIGKFSLTVFKNENGINCSYTQSFTVINPEKPVFLDINVDTEDPLNNIVDVNVEGNSSYTFSLDNVNFFGNGTNYVFSNVEAGLQTVYVKDINDCEQPIQTTVAVIGFKKYFTPNGDGSNDFWNVVGLSATSFKSINLYVYDRFGKIVKTITDFNSLGWDGTYNGKELLENSYWFTVKIVDKNDNLIERSGNFSLIRD